MVFVTGLRENTSHMFAGVESHAWAGFPLFVLAMVLVGLAWWDRFTIHDPACPFGAADRAIHGRLDQGPLRMVGAECSAHGTGHFTLFLVERNHAELRRV